MERTLVLLKPDAVQRGVVGEIVSRFERKGLRLVGMKLRRFDEKILSEHYASHRGKPFYGGLLRFMSSGPVVAIALEGENAIAVTRNLMGKTNSADAAPGTIRGDLGMSVSFNLVHGSDGAESAKKELGLFFAGKDEIVDWTPVTEAWVYDVEG